MRAIRLVWRSGPGRAVATVAVTVAQGVLPLVALYLMKLMVDAVADGITADDKVAAFGKIALYVGIAAGLALVNSAFAAFSTYLSRSQARHFADHMQSLVHEKSVSVDLAYFEDPTYHDTLHRARSEANSRPLAIVSALIGLIQSTVGGIAIVGLLIGLHWAVPLVLFVICVPAMLVRVKYSRELYRWYRGRTPMQRLGGYLSRVLTGDDHAKEVRLFGLGREFISRYQDARAVLRGEELAVRAREALGTSLAQAASVVAGFGAFLFIGYRAIHGHITIGDLVMYYQAFQRGQGFIAGGMQGLAGIGEHGLFLRNLFEFLDLESRVLEPEAPQPVPRPIRKGIAFEGVSFEYPSGTRPVLESIDLAVAPNEVVALVGGNGAGKTTIVKLLCRLYDPTSGRISIDGVDLRELGTADLRREIAVVLQDYSRYHFSARENIRIGNIELPADDSGIIDAARRAGADGFIENLPAGYDTILGRWFEDGEELSVGEWQKVALARALARDAQLVVLDEPTSSMDALAEQEIFHAFKDLIVDRAGIIISHRFSTVRIADRICVVADGRIVEEGPHDELVRLGGIYAELFEAQAQHYR